jgi:hypothetical protein
MQGSADSPTPESRARADMLLRRVTRWSVMVATGVTALIGVVVSQEDPGASSRAATSTSQSSTTAADKSSTVGTSNSTAPTSTASTPHVTSGGTSR